jgi:hypothetical protein
VRRFGRAVLLALIPFLAGALLARGQEVDVDRYSPATRGGRSAIVDLVADHFPPDQVEAALAVIRCESRFDPDATGRAGERGLFQVHPLWQRLAERLYWPGVSLYDAEVNVAVAAAIWRAAGWRPWACRPW